VSWSHDYWVDQSDAERELAGLPLGLPIERLSRRKCRDCKRRPDPGHRLCRRCLDTKSAAARRKRAQARAMGASSGPMASSGSNDGSAQQ